MTYLYICPNCNNKVTISKPMSESTRTEYCEVCEGELKRVYEAPVIATMDGIKY